MASQSALPLKTPSWGDGEAALCPGCLSRERAQGQPGSRHRTRGLWDQAPSPKWNSFPPSPREPAGGRGGLAPSFRLRCSEAHSTGLSPRPGGPRGSVGSWRGPRVSTPRDPPGGPSVEAPLVSGPHARVRRIRSSADALLKAAETSFLRSLCWSLVQFTSSPLVMVGAASLLPALLDCPVWPPQLQAQVPRPMASRPLLVSE